MDKHESCSRSLKVTLWKSSFFLTSLQAYTWGFFGHWQLHLSLKIPSFHFRCLNYFLKPAKIYLFSSHIIKVQVFCEGNKNLKTLSIFLLSYQVPSNISNFLVAFSGYLNFTFNTVLYVTLRFWLTGVFNVLSTRSSTRPNKLFVVWLNFFPKALSSSLFWVALSFWA